MSKKLEMTKEYIDALTDEQLKQMVMCTNDGQGDTNVSDVEDIRAYFEPHHIEGKSNSDFLKMLWEDTNANMTTFIWIENSDFHAIHFVDLWD